MIRNIVVAFFSLLAFSYSFGNNNLDSLFKVLSKSKEDTNKVNVINNIAAEYKKTSADSAIFYLKKSITLSNKINWGIGSGKTYHILALSFFERGEMQASLEYNFTAVSIWDSLLAQKDTALEKIILSKKSKTVGNIGLIYFRLGNYAEALNKTFNALKLAEEIGDIAGVGRHFGNIGNIYLYQKDYKKAIDYYQQALKISLEQKSTLLIINNKLNIGLLYYYLKDYSRSEIYLTDALTDAEKANYNPAIAAALANIGVLYKEKGDYDKALFYYKKGLEKSKELNDKNGSSLRLGNIGEIYFFQKKHADAEKCFKEALLLANQVGNAEAAKAILSNLSRNDSATGKFQSALNYYKQYIIIRDSLSNEENVKKQTQVEMQYEFDKKESRAKAEQTRKDELALADKKKQKIILVVVTCILSLVGLFAFIIFRNLRTVQKQKIIIGEQKAIVESQKALVETKQKEVIDSIHYAKRIQESLLPTEKYIERILKLKR